MDSEKTLLYRLLNIDRRIIWVIMILLIAIPLIYPLGLPIPVDKYTMAFYETVENLPPGSNILMCCDFDAGNMGENGPQWIALMKRLFTMDVNFIQVAFNRADTAVIFTEWVLSEVNQRDKEYGIDWVNIGYIEGKETAMSAFARDFLFATKDYYGDDLADMPLLKEVRSMEDIDLYIGVGEAEVRQFVVPFNVPAIAPILAVRLPEYINYYDAGIIYGMISGLPGAAEYESLTGYPGRAISGLDALSATHVFLIVLLIVTNISYIIDRNQRRK